MASAAALRVTLPTAGTWRPRFPAERLDGPTDDPRPGPPRTIAAARVEEAVTKTSETEPTDAARRGTRGRAGAAGMTQTAVARIWRAFGLQPHLRETSELSADPYPVETVRDAVGSHLDPPDRAVRRARAISPDPRPPTGRSRSSRRPRGGPIGAPTTPPGPAPPRRPRRWTRRPGGPSASATAGTGTGSP